MLPSVERDVFEAFFGTLSDSAKLGDQFVTALREAMNSQALPRPDALLELILDHRGSLRE